MKLLNKDTFFIGTCLAIIAVFSVLLYLDFNEKIQRNETKQIGTITFKKRTAERKYTGQVLWDSIDQDSPVFNFDTIRTEEEALAVIYLQDGTEIELGADTLVQLNLSKQQLDVQFEKGDISANRSSSQVDTGKVSIFSGNSTVKMEDGGVNISKTSDKSVAVNVTSGNATVSAGGKATVIDNTSAAVVDSAGKTEIKKHKYFLMEPSNSAYYVTADGKSDIQFSWNGKSTNKTRLIISKDSSFKKIFKSYSANGNKLKISIQPGRYYWKIQGEDGESSTRKFTLLNEKRPQIVFPENKTIFSYFNAPPMLKFRWRKAAYSTSYSIEVFSDSNLRNKVLDMKSRGNYISTNKLDAGVYYWRVKNKYGMNIKGSSITSELYRFKIEKKKSISIPEISENEQKATISAVAISSGKESFTWNSVSEADSYEIEIATDKNFKNTIVRKKTLYNYYTPPKNLKKGEYYWRVKAVSSNEKSKPSSPTKFTVAGIARIATIIPENGKAYVNYNSVINFRWNDPNKGSKYIVELSKTKNFSKIYKNYELKKRNFSLKDIDFGRYYWRVFLIDSNKKRIASSNVSYFSIPQKLGSPKLVAPVKNKIIDVLVTNKILFSWKRVPKATHYEFIIYKNVAGVKKIFLNKTIRSNYYSFDEFDKLGKGKYSWEVTPYLYSGKTVKGIGKSSFADFTVTVSKKLSKPVILTPEIIYVK